MFVYDTLKVGGHFVCKFYQGAEDKEFENELRKIFTAVHREKPESSRSVSFACLVFGFVADFYRNPRKRILLP